MNNLDFSLPFTKPQQARFKHPAPQHHLRSSSSRIAVSSRVWPEYLHALYVLFEQRYGHRPSSISELVNDAIGHLLVLEQVEELPPAIMSLEFLSESGFISGRNKRNVITMAGISHRNEESEELSQSSTLLEQATYWKFRDPAKYEELLALLEQQLLDGLSGL